MTKTPFLSCLDTCSRGDKVTFNGRTEDLQFVEEFDIDVSPVQNTDFLLYGPRDGSYVLSVGPGKRRVYSRYKEQWKVYQTLWNVETNEN